MSGRCPNTHCPRRLRELRYIEDGVSVCLDCAEMSRDGRVLSLEDFTRLAPAHQTAIGSFRQSVQLARGHYDWLRDQGCVIQGVM